VWEERALTVRTLVVIVDLIPAMKRAGTLPSVAGCRFSAVENTLDVAISLLEE
jgi:hypothetical protein